MLRQNKSIGWSLLVIHFHEFTINNSYSSNGEAPQPIKTWNLYWDKFGLVIQLTQTSATYRGNLKAVLPKGDAEIYYGYKAKEAYLRKSRGWIIY